MSLSANTLFHFTNSKEALKKILEENFRIFHCRESVILNGKAQNFYVPLVSFCDIPLSEVKDHISKYGTYGLGLTKNWGIKHALNPVLYVSQTSALSASYRKAMRHFALQNGTGKEDEEFTEEEMALLDILRYMKNYEAPLIRKGTTTPNYRFSDEREWRYAPPYTKNFDMLVPRKIYEEDKLHYDSQLENLRLSFEPNDIKYIIINDESEIGEFIDHLRRAKGKNYSLHDVERLTTRIFTTEQIRTDV